MFFVNPEHNKDCNETTHIHSSQKINKYVFFFAKDGEGRDAPVRNVFLLSLPIINVFTLRVFHSNARLERNVLNKVIFYTMDTLVCYSG